VADALSPLDLALHPLVVVTVWHADEELAEHAAHGLDLVCGSRVADPHQLPLVERRRTALVPAEHEEFQERTVFRHGQVLCVTQVVARVQG
jgi:hypothetical protein